ncbi:hypothetical protein [Metabacillus malikii]|nr:hypothetical protein [Metabacillus malikii]
MNVLGNKSNHNFVLGIISILIPVVVTILIINFFSAFILLEKLQGLPVIMPIFLCPIGAMLGFISYRLYKGKLSLIGIIINILLFMFPIIYHVLGTFYFGV